MNTPQGLQLEMLAQLADRRPFERAREYAYNYLDGVLSRRAFPGPDAIRGLEAFDEPLPAAPASPEGMLQMLHEYGSPATVANAGGRYFGFVTGGALPAAMAARWLLDVWDQNPALYLLSPVSAQLENVCERWLVELLGLPAGTAAGYVVGTSAATLCGLVAGRNHLLARQGWDVNANGLFGAPPLRVVVGEQAHATVFRALGVLGLGQARIERVPVDSEGRMIASRVPVLDERSLVIVQAGNVNSGSFDPIAEICDRARQVGAWVHVDGAFGLWAAASRKRRALVAGVEEADSWSIDAHKTLNAPYDNGIVLCRKREALVAAVHMSASYILYGNERNGTQYTTDLSRRARAIELWATLKSLGRFGVEDLVDRLCDHAERFAALLRERRFRVLNEVVFNQVLVACETPAMTLATIARLQESGECWCGGATWNDEPVIRISVCSWATTSDDVDRSVAAFVAARKRAESDDVQLSDAIHEGSEAALIRERCDDSTIA